MLATSSKRYTIIIFLSITTIGSISAQDFGAFVVKARVCGAKCSILRRAKAHCERLL